MLTIDRFSDQRGIFVAVSAVRCAMSSTCSKWVLRDFSGADLGDARRTRRLVTMLEGIEAFRGRTVAATFLDAAERQAAYDFLEHETVAAADLDRAASAASSRNARLLPEVLVVVDGTSLSLVDKERRKDFGSIGSKAMATRGLKYMTSLLVAPTGVPIGIGPLTWWRRVRNAVSMWTFSQPDSFGAGLRQNPVWTGSSGPEARPSTEVTGAVPNAMLRGGF